MYREESLDEISDGKLYTENDMVKADTAGCTGCRQVCCHGMGSSIILDPFDVHRLTTRLGMTMEQLLDGYIEINITDGIMLPNLVMNPATGSCSFLNDDNKCRIHTARPGVCRLFPLGRYWEDETHFKYILQKDQCNKDNLSKIKVKKWINSEYGARYDDFIIRWHSYLVRIKNAVEVIQTSVSEDTDIQTVQTQIRTICMYTLKTFYLTEYGTDEEFFESIGDRIDKALSAMGMD